MGDPQIYVRGFPKYTSEEDLKTAFGAYGEIKEIRMIRDYAFIVLTPNIKVFENDDCCGKAVEEMNGKDINDQRVRVEVAGQPKKPKGPQPNDECRLCGRKGHWYCFIYVGRTTALTYVGIGSDRLIQKKEKKEPFREFVFLKFVFIEREEEKVDIV